MKKDINTMEKVIYKLCEYRISQNENIELEKKLTQELENEIWEYFKKTLYEGLYDHIVLQIKIYLFLYIVYKIIENILKYIDSRSNYNF